MAGRTYGQVATPTSFGAVVAGWGMPLIRHLDRLAELRPRLLRVSLSGAAGTLAAMGGKGPRSAPSLPACSASPIPAQAGTPPATPSPSWLAG